MCETHLNREKLKVYRKFVELADRVCKVLPDVKVKNFINGFNKK